MIIAIDGYSSTGKSSFAKLIAARLGYIYIDTGALYRAVTLFALNHNFIDRENRINESALSKAMECLNIEFRLSPLTGKSDTFINDICVEEQIRGIEVSDKVSYISALPFVRVFVDDILKKIGKERGVVMDGRDIGTAVFPDAEIKIFMTASEEVRARRRMSEMQANGSKVTYEEVLENVKKRDYLDQNRETAPLRMAEDAVLLDNSDMTLDQEIVWFDNFLKERCG